MALGAQTKDELKLRRQTAPREPGAAESLSGELASVFALRPWTHPDTPKEAKATGKTGLEPSSRPTPEFIYRTLIEQIPAVVFLAYLDERICQAHVSPQIEAILGFSREERIDDPILWLQQLHPEDRSRWSLEAASMFLSGEPLKSTYRVLARDGRVVWFQCEARMVRHTDGQPWFILGVGFDITEFKEAEQALAERTESLRRLSTTLLESQDQERRRIARELHDGIGQYLVALKLNFEMLAWVQRKEHPELWGESERLLEQCLSHTRNLSYLLHPPLLDDAGLLLASKAYVEGFSKRSGIETKLTLPDSLPEISKAFELALFRVLQESLTNVVRHSGSKTVEIRLQVERVAISLEIVDCGRGMPVQILHRFARNLPGSGVGLRGMRERMAELGGRFEVNSDSHGTRVKVLLPFARGGSASVRQAGKKRVAKWRRAA